MAAKKKKKRTKAKRRAIASMIDNKLKAAERSGYIRGWNACKNNPGEG
jgi:hypothetical protein